LLTEDHVVREVFSDAFAGSVDHGLPMVSILEEVTFLSEWVSWLKGGWARSRKWKIFNFARFL